jgi:hypothetical protein
MSEKFTLRLRHPATAECVADQEIQHINQADFSRCCKVRVRTVCRDGLRAGEEASGARRGDLRCPIKHLRSRSCRNE